MKKSALLVVTMAALMAVTGVVRKPNHTEAQAGRPNVVFVLTDDQRWDALNRMPKLQAALADHGVKFSNAVVDNPWCCPSRVSFLTGNRSHMTGVWNNNPYGWDRFNDGSTLATWLHSAGYRTALVGKYLNGYESRPAYVPPGWDVWRALTYHTYSAYNYKVSENGVERSFGTADADYKTEVLANYADKFIRGTPASRPLFLYLATNAPHPPAQPARRYATANVSLPAWNPPAYNEADMSDKPAYMRALSSITSSEPSTVRMKQFRSLLSVDDAIGKVTQALTDKGRLGSTIFIFASDNGFLWGEHRVMGKVVPYTESIRIPLMIRYDPLTSPRVDDHLIANVDLAPTIAELTGIQSPSMEGRSLVSFLSGQDDPTWRQDTLIEHVIGGGNAFEKTIPTYCGVHSNQYTYVVYSTGERELYDNQADPYQLQNVVNDPAYAGVVADRDLRLRELCQPTPPGFNFPPKSLFTDLDNR